MKQNYRRNLGFTLIEMMVVVVIIGILAAFLVGNFMGQADRAMVKATTGIIGTVGGHIDMFKLDTGRYPEKLEDLMTKPSYVKKDDWPRGGYVRQRKGLEDGWGEPLQYRVPGSNDQPYDLGSFGADKKEGGDGIDADLWNHD